MSALLKHLMLPLNTSHFELSVFESMFQVLIMWCSASAWCGFTEFFEFLIAAYQWYGALSRLKARIYCNLSLKRLMNISVSS